MNWYRKIKIAQTESDNEPSRSPTEWQQADSSSIDRFRYDSANRRLWIRFHNGYTYYYSDVPATTYENFLRASSKGRFFIDNIRKRFEHTRAD